MEKLFSYSYSIRIQQFSCNSRWLATATAFTLHSVTNGIKNIPVPENDPCLVSHWHRQGFTVQLHCALFQWISLILLLWLH